MTEPVAAEGRGAIAEVSLGTILWVAAGALFVVWRVAGLVSLPVGGPEIDALSGAWQASIGHEDSRFIPTLFQGISSLLLQVDDSELWPRLLAVAASASIPFALYQLRPMLSEAGALIALALLAFDAPGILIDASANASAFDIPLALWFLVFANGERRPPWAWSVAAFLLASGGALVLPVILAVAVAFILRQQTPEPTYILAVGGGAFVAVAAASFQYGLGWGGVAIPPLETFAAGFEREWSTDSAARLVVIYLAPLLVAAIPAAVWAASQALPDLAESPWTAPLVWFAVSLTWLVLSLGDANPLPLAAVSVPAALLLGPAIAHGWNHLARADWTWARYLVPAALMALFIALSFLMDWADSGRTGEAAEHVFTWGMMLVGLGCVALLLGAAETRATAVLVAVPFLAFPHLAGVSGVAFGGPNEPMPSPISPVQAREIRDIAVNARGEAGGSIVIHERYEEAVTWAFRNSGTVVFATQPPLDAVAIVWPTELPRPDGFSIVDGQWALLRERTGPEGDWLDYLRWYFDRNTLGVGSVPVSVYLKGAE